MKKMWTLTSITWKQYNLLDQSAWMFNLGTNASSAMIWPVLVRKLKILNIKRGNIWEYFIEKITYSKTHSGVQISFITTSGWDDRSWKFDWWGGEDAHVPEISTNSRKAFTEKHGNHHYCKKKGSLIMLIIVYTHYMPKRLLTTACMRA